MSLTLQKVFQRNTEAFFERYCVSSEMFRAAWCVKHCRTVELGGHVNSCPEGHYDAIAYNSCGHRCCPQCGWLDRERWLAGWKQRLLPTPHHHIVFTLPNQLVKIWRFNKRAFSNVLFQAATETLFELLADPKYLGARPGILAALHTWNQLLQPHIHLHCVATAGGLTSDGRWVTPQKSCLLPRKVLMIKFRGKFKALLRRAAARGEISLPKKQGPVELAHQLAQLSRKSWNVKIHEAYNHGKGVATYLARYIQGGPIGNGRLISEENGLVKFRYRLGTHHGGDGKRQATASYKTEKFIGLWLEHVPPKGLRMVRGYGLYCGNQHSRLDEAFVALEASPPSSADQQRSWQEWCESAGMTDICRCPICNRRLVSHHEFASGRSPPPGSMRHTVSGTAA